MLPQTSNAQTNSGLTYAKQGSVTVSLWSFLLNLATARSAHTGRGIGTRRSSTPSRRASTTSVALSPPSISLSELTPGSSTLSRSVSCCSESACHMLDAIGAAVLLGRLGSDTGSRLASCGTLSCSCGTLSGTLSCGAEAAARDTAGAGGAISAGVVGWACGVQMIILGSFHWPE